MVVISRPTPWAHDSKKTLSLLRQQLTKKTMHMIFIKEWAEMSIP